MKFTMVPLVSFLAALRILTEAQSCNNGLGKLVYEKVADYRMIGTSSFATKASRELIAKNELPIKVLEECVQRCQEDKVTTISSCQSFDFAPGRRRSSPYHMNNPNTGQIGATLSADYEESKCILYDTKAAPDGKDALVKQEHAWHFNEICLNSKKLTTDCNNRLYTFERIPGYRYNGAHTEYTVTNRSECEERCLDEDCRSVSFNKVSFLCSIHKETRYNNPRGFIEDKDSDYMENMCLKKHQMCSSIALILETFKELDGPFERELLTTSDINECKDICLNALEERGFLCRSFMFDSSGHTCILYDEDPLYYGDRDRQRPLKKSPGDLYRILCGKSDDSISNATLECYRRKRLDGPHEVEITAFSFYDCLEECTRRYGRNCKSVEYSSEQRSCRFSSGENNQWSKNLVDDPSFDYYKFIYHRSHNSHTFSPNHGLIPSPEGYHGYNFGFGGQMPEGFHGHDGSSSGNIPNYSPHGSSHNWPIWRDHRHRGGYGYERHHPNFPSSYPGPPTGPSLNPAVAGSPGHASTNIGAPPLGHGPHWMGPPLAHGINHPAAIPSPAIVPPHNSFGMTHDPTAQHGYHDYRSKPPFPQFRPGLPTYPNEGCKYSSGGSRFTRIGFGSRLRSTYIFKVLRAERLEQCEAACIESRDFPCRSFNFRVFSAENCELSQYDSKSFPLDNPVYFEQSTQYDFYERENQGDCLEVSQTCTPDGMEFTLKSDGFYGRIYTYGFYDSCFFDGNGGSVSVLRISRANGFPRCGTQQYGDAMTNIVVVQFNDWVQTSRDKKYNLTCYFSGPGEAVVTSSYLDTKTDGRYPTQIENLPAQNILTSNVVLRILYRGTPTNTIVVGDLLTFRLEARGHYRYDYYNSDIFATNVIAKDPYTGRQVHLIDSRGCPVDLYVFPELHKTPDGALEAEFYAFKIPDSNFLVFQATVRTCRGQCEPVICTDRGRGPGSFPSWGRKKRSLNSTNANNTNSEEEVHELLRVYLSRAEVPEVAPLEDKVEVCVPSTGYYALVVSVAVMTFVSIGFGGILWVLKHKQAKSIASIGCNPNFYVTTKSKCNVDDPSEPIYTDPSLFERSRSLRSVTISHSNEPF